MLTREDRSGAPSFTLTGPAARVTVVPAWGGKMASLVDPRSNREWLWRNPALPARLPQYDASYVEAFDSGGWDECFPAVARGYHPSGPWQGTRIPDHGELWALPWDVLATADDALSLAVTGVRFPIRFERTLSLTDTGLRLDYRVDNPTPFAFPFVWCAHPLLAVKPGMQLLLPDDTPLQAYGRDLGSAVRLPDTLPPATAGLAVKAFGRSPAAGWAAVRDGQSELRFEWDPAVVTHLGIWLNAGGWSGVPGASPYYNLGLEPGIGAGDDLAIAASVLDQAGSLPPKGSLAWTLHVHLS